MKEKSSWDGLGFALGIILWNLLPIFIVACLFLFATLNDSKYLFGGGVGFLLTGIGVHLYYHTAMVFDWFEIATGSSTSGILYLYLPIISIVFGAIGLLLGLGYTYLHAQ